MTSEGVNIFILYGWWAHFISRGASLIDTVLFQLRGRNYEPHRPAYVQVSPCLLPCIELGLSTNTEPLGMDFEYFRIASHMKPHFVPDGNGCAELVIVVSSHDPLFLHNS